MGAGRRAGWADWQRRAAALTSDVADAVLRAASPDPRTAWRDRQLERELTREALESRLARQRALAIWERTVASRKRSLRAARRSLAPAAVTAGVSAVAMVPLGHDAQTLAGAVAVGACVRVATAVRALRSREPLPERPQLDPPVPGPPPRGSAAFPAVRRLVEQERVLASLLATVTALAPWTTDATDAAAAAGRAGAIRVRTAAATVGLLERARTPTGELLKAIDEELAAFDRLLAAAGVLAHAATLPWDRSGSGAQGAVDALLAAAYGLRVAAGVEPDHRDLPLAGPER